MLGFTLLGFEVMVGFVDDLCMCDSIFRLVGVCAGALLVCRWGAGVRGGVVGRGQRVAASVRNRKDRRGNNHAKFFAFAPACVRACVLACSRAMLAVFLCAF